MKTPRRCPNCGHNEMDRSRTVALDQCPRCKHAVLTPDKQRRASTTKPVRRPAPLSNTLGDAFAALNLTPTR